MPIGSDAKVGEPYTLGLDIGIASVGAALLSDRRILALYVRTFDKAEVAKTGESLGLIRRQARGIRRRLRRRTHRLLRLRRLFKRVGLCSSTELSSLTVPGQSPWGLRAQGLDRRLSNHEWACVLYHIVKHRGFQSTRKSEAKADEKVGQMLSGVSANKKLMEEKNYRTVGEMAACDEQFHDAKRNKAGSYSHTFDRSDLVQELRLLFEQQRTYDNIHADSNFEAAVYDLLMARRPALSGKQLLNMVGMCSLEPQEYRAPKASYRAERFVWLGKLNNLKLIGMGESRSLTMEERQAIIDLPFGKAKLTYKQVRNVLDLPDSTRFNLVAYRNFSEKDPEDSVFYEAKAYHQIKKSYHNAGLNELWRRDALDPDRLDDLAYALTCFKDDSESRLWLSERGVESEIIEAVLELSFDKFISFSQKALIKILPMMETGSRVDEVRAQFYPEQPVHDMVKSRFIPKPDKNVIRNPVVYRALNQARKLVNAIVAEHGAPCKVHIELARDLSKPFSERRKIEKEQKSFYDKKEDQKKDFLSKFGYEGSSKQLHKLRLYVEQDGKCAYSLKPLDLNRVIEDDGYSQIDHVLPYSRSFDDSQNNKVLVLTVENQNKGNRTPYEYLGGDEGSDRWRHFEAWVQASKGLRLAMRNRLLRRNFGVQEATEFRERNLNDTRYICREFKSMVERYLARHPSSNPHDFCVPVAGQLTALLRSRWGLIKIREDGDLHHAMDAAVIAAASRSMVQRMARYAQRRELSAIHLDNYVDTSTGEIIDLDALRKIDKAFPLPWPNFHYELEAWLSPNPADVLLGLEGYGPEVVQAIKPIRVSRAPLRRGSGPAHQETIRSIGKQGTLLKEGLSAVKTRLTDLKLADLDNILGANDPRNANLMNAIRTRLEAFNGDGAKAFAATQPPLYKPSKPGKVAPVISSVKLCATQKSGIFIRQGIANNGSMIRVDIFAKGGKYFLVPLYASDLVKSDLPNKAVASGKPEDEWPVMDDDYSFCFSVFANDWLRITLKGDVKEGYFSSLDRATGAISIWVHDRNMKIGKDGLLRSIGIKTALSVEKFHVDMLGRLYRCQPEKRQPLSLLRQGG